MYLVLPAGVVPLDLQSIHHRIKENVDVLSNFAAKREEGKGRGEYISLLRSDLCTYYSYNDFLMEKLMDIFPVSEVKHQPLNVSDMVF